MIFINYIKSILYPFYKEKRLKEIFKILNFENQNSAMLVGGCVRNFLNKEPIGDIDIATTVKPQEIVKKFSNTDFKVIESGIDHGTVTLNKNNQSFEITTLREDLETDGRHAKISYTDDWKKDSERRDLTINAIYLDEKGNLYDPQNGVKDLKEKKIKFIGNPERRIHEDYLRILRFVRFSIKYDNFGYDNETLKIIKKNLNGVLKLSKERIFSELKKMIHLDNFQNIMHKKEYLEILKLIFPELKYLDRIKINDNSFKKILDKDKDLLLALMLVDNTDNHEYFSHKYKVSNILKKYLNFISIYFAEAKKNKNFFNKDLKKNIFYHNKDNIKILTQFYFICLKKDYSDYRNIVKKIDSTTIPNFPITGKYLIEKGIKGGEKIGKILKLIENKWVQNDFKLEDDDLNKLINKNLN